MITIKYKGIEVECTSVGEATNMLENIIGTDGDIQCDSAACKNAPTPSAVYGKIHTEVSAFLKENHARLVAYETMTGWKIHPDAGRHSYNSYVHTSGASVWPAGPIEQDLYYFQPCDYDPDRKRPALPLVGAMMTAVRNKK